MVYAIGIILTCAVSPKSNISFLKQTDPNQRLDCYIKSIQKWISDPDILAGNIPIVVVDNSNWEFTRLRQAIQEEATVKNRVEVLSYLESVTDSQEKGYYECLSIQWAIKNSKLLQNCDFIIKVTGRYHVPNLIPTVKSLLTENKHIGCVRQDKGFRCEIVGFRKELYVYLFDPYGINPKYILERALADRTVGLNSVQLPPMEIEPTRNGGFDTIVTSL